MTSYTCGTPMSFNSDGMSLPRKSCTPKVATCGVYGNNAPSLTFQERQRQWQSHAPSTQQNIVEEHGKPLRISYLVPMSPASSVSIAKAAETSNLNIVKEALVQQKNNMFSSIKGFDFNIAEAFQNAAYGGMSLWFLVLAVLICVILFSSRQTL